MKHTSALLEAAGAPPPDWVGLGGEVLAAAGVETRADPTARAAMGGQGVLGELGFWRAVLRRAAEALPGCDAALLVDAPALHVPLARIARRAGVPSLHHIAPQYWAWAPWRVKAYRAAVTRSLCILPFEAAWFARHGVSSEYVGHPQLDHLVAVPAPPPEDPARRAIALLPGSRAAEIRQLLPLMLRAALQVRAPQTPLLVLQQDARHAAAIEAILQGSPARLSIGNLHGELARSRSALAASGTVLVDLLHQRLPTVVLYALQGRVRTLLSSWLVTVPHFAVTNLLAGEEVLPERAFPAADPPPTAELASLLERCHRDEAWRRRCLAGLERAARRLGGPGASRRAAGHLLELAHPKVGSGPHSPA